MTGPEQVSVNVAALRLVKDWWYSHDAVQPSDTKTRHAFFHLFDAMPEPEWEPTDDMRAKGKRLLRAIGLGDQNANDLENLLRAMHREELL